MANGGFLNLNGRLAEILQQAIGETLKDTFQIRIHPEAWRVGREMPKEIDSLEISQIDLRQESVSYGAFIAAFDREILLKILSQYNPKGVSDQEMIDDAAAEIANMVYGLFKTAVNRSGYHLAMNVPVTPKAKADIIEKYKNAEKLIQPFMVDGRQCLIIIAQNH